LKTKYQDFWEKKDKQEEEGKEEGNKIRHISIMFFA